LIENDNSWRKLPITEKQVMVLHDLVCEWFEKLTRGQASDLINILLREDGNPFANSFHKFDGNTLKENK
jgi:hypothetical protein